MRGRQVLSKRRAFKKTKVNAFGGRWVTGHWSKNDDGEEPLFTWMERQGYQGWLLLTPLSMQRTMERIYRRSSDFLAEVLGCKVDFGPLNFLLKMFRERLMGNYMQTFCHILPFGWF